jgi:hypothetical protein
MSDAKKTVVKEDKDIPRYKNKMYWEEPSLLDKAKINLNDAATGAYDAVNTLTNARRESKPVEKAKGGMIKSSASKRADGCAVKGKTRGRYI